jgi:hypothetical protein
MKTAVGIFSSRAAAERAAHGLRSLGITAEHLNFLTPGAADDQPEAVPTTDTEQPGMGKALGGVVGGAMGASGGLFAAAMASAFVPGVGPITAIGLAAAALFGVGGVAAGVAAGGALENAMSEGLPKDELFVYEDALRQGYTVLVALTDDTPQREAALRILETNGAESLDAARERWWVGLVEPEDEVYTGPEGSTAPRGPAYQRGLAAALQSETFGKTYDEVQGYLQTHYGDVYKDEAFRRGYERGRVYSESFGERWEQAAATHTGKDTTG